MELLCEIRSLYHLVPPRSILRELRLLTTRSTSADSSVIGIHTTVGCCCVSELFHGRIQVATLGTDAEVMCRYFLRIKAFIIETSEAKHGTTCFEAAASISLLVQVQLLVRHNSTIPMIIVI